MRHPAIALAIVLILSGCGEPPGTGTDASADGAADGAVDAAGTGVVDGAVDGAPADDRDGDGVDDSVDCDATDPAVGATSSAPCETLCGAGTIECRDGVTAECTAPADCLCSAGETRVVECPLCGMQPQGCGAEGVFEDDGECLYQGACEPGTVEDDMSRCGHRRRLCGEECEWLEWEEIVRPRACNPGDVMWCPAGDDVICNDSCVWGGLCD